MRGLIVLLLLLGCGGETEKQTNKPTKPDPKPEPKVEKPEAPQPNWPSVELPAAWKTWKHPGDWKPIVFTLDHEGGLFHDENGKEMLNLDELRSMLDGKKDADVLLRIDRRAPWKHVQLMMIMLAEKQARRIWFGVTSRSKVGEASTGRVSRLRLWLPMEAGLSPTGGDKLGAMTSVRRKNNGVTFEYGKDKTDKELQLAKWIKEEFDYAMEDGIRAEQLYGDIRATGKNPTSLVISIASMYRAAGFPEVRFYGTQIPTTEARRAKPLPAVK